MNIRAPIHLVATLWARVTPRARRRASLAARTVFAAYLLGQVALALPPVRAWARLCALELARSRIGEVSLGEVGFDPLFRVVAGPLALGGDREHPVVTVERLRLRVSPLALLVGRLEPASIRLYGVHVDAAQVEVGPLTVDLWPARGDEARWRAEAWAPDGGRAQIDLVRGAALDVQLRVTHLSPAVLGSVTDALPVRFVDGLADLDLRANVARDLEHAQGAFRVGVSNVVLESPRLAHEPVGPFRVSAEGRFTWDREGTLDLRETTIGLGDLALRAAVEATVSRGPRDAPNEPRFSVSLRASGVPFDAFGRALPTALGPPPGAPHPAGDLDLRFVLGGPLLTPEDWTLQAGLDLSRMRAATRRGPAVALRSSFSYEPEGGRPFVVGPENPTFVPVSELPEHVVRAVTTAEDGGFFAHQGFDFDELGIALAEGIEAGRVVRGGSTITQQLAKNLFLTRDKVFARKVQEALAAIALEATLSKSRLIEIYLNVAEWGPDVYGIGPAARHWFDKDARQLSVKEAAFLASVIPNPRRYDAMRASGTLTPSWELRVSAILHHMAEHDALSPDALVNALSETLVFAESASSASAPPKAARLRQAARPTIGT